MMMMFLYPSAEQMQGASILMSHKKPNPKSNSVSSVEAGQDQ